MHFPKLPNEMRLADSIFSNYIRRKASSHKTQDQITSIFNHEAIFASDAFDLTSLQADIPTPLTSDLISTLLKSPTTSRLHGVRTKDRGQLQVLPLRPGPPRKCAKLKS